MTTLIVWNEPYQNDDGGKVDDDPEPGQEQDAEARRLTDGTHLEVFRKLFILVFIHFNITFTSAEFCEWICLLLTLYLLSNSKAVIEDNNELNNIYYEQHNLLKRF